ncbi:MAG: hypothetical protein HC840_01415 [Leptolyngbyaceae cyanobacterium RM2_2_4]|nr:hypothetical protein [Leptolyngbyaceae cyanobacterium SM1_4_3]NJN89481.1 hypothetical protein [Leptolyngbyaceae cyanobacterium SL_5_14]NJO48355.1 hypothetical protein [Leptolyngbyaceae cyanobacterium RM2_2_4]
MVRWRWQLEVTFEEVRTHLGGISKAFSTSSPKVTSLGKKRSERFGITDQIQAVLAGAGLKLIATLSKTI